MRPARLVAPLLLVSGLGCAQQTPPSAPPAFRTPNSPERERAVGDLEGLAPPLRAALSDTAAFRPIRPPAPEDWLSQHAEPGQTFAQFVASSPNRPGADRNAIYLQPILDFPPADAPSLDFLRRFTESYFGLRVALLPPLTPAPNAITERTNLGARQLLTGDLLKLLAKRLPPDAHGLLGVTMVDLYAGDSWNFVFGEASLRERVGVFSFARYRVPPSAGGDVARALVLHRSAKVLAHEIGHLFGMAHCTFYACAMNGSNHLPEMDAAPIHLCPVCLRKLQWSARFDVESRYRALARLCREGGFTEDAAWLEARLSPVPPTPSRSPRR